ncbi:HAMP domain-containing histidine kinase [Exilibacterium tricleocarpae]|uniref:histidine kinase n=1 Tax=Exilibacterium tricleocarpae TaxID=2591008 RepID=A0A545SS37_9GAMM|nr:HAMP domain-containing sensor histidine kinase [Exilibacterium tricleocarpae]TQV67765.1 HAMP domain-containing histidine kinase [Exilibacterium tricleocarpae]
MHARLQATLADFLNAGLDPQAVSPVALRQYRTVNTCAAIVCVASLIFLWRAWQWDILPRMLSLGYCTLTAGAGLWMLRRRTGPALAAHLVLSGVFVAICLGAYSSGGIGRVVAGWFYIVPMLAGLMLGARACLHWGVATVLAIVALLALENLAGPLEDMTPIRFRHSQDRLQQVVQLVTIILITLSYLRQVQQSESALLGIIERNNEEIAARIRAQEEAQAANRSRSEFLASMSHELRTPLNAIIGFSRRLVQKLEAGTEVDPQKTDMALVSIHRNGLILLNFINDLIAIARAESGGVVLNYGSVELTRLVMQALARVEAQAQAAGLYLRNQCPADMVIEADAGRLRQVFDNLLSNAVKYTDSGGVVVTCGSSSRFGSGEGVAVSVRDSGCGIAPEQQPYLFESHTNIEAPMTRAGASSGLGLALSRRWVQLHGGTIEVVSELGEGTEFIVHLPRKKSVPQNPL